MADLDPLIRIRKYAIDQKQKFLSELYRQAEEMENQKKTMERQLEEEKEKIREMGIELQSYFMPYAKVVRERIEDVEDAIQKLDKRIEMAQEDMRMAFAELKKIEIIQERREEEEIKRIEQKETALLDEIAIEGFRRNSEED